MSIPYLQQLSIEVQKHCSQRRSNDVGLISYNLPFILFVQIREFVQNRAEPYTKSIKYCMHFLQTLFFEKSESMAMIHSKLAKIRISCDPNQDFHCNCAPKPTLVLLCLQQADAIHKTKQKHN